MSTTTTVPISSPALAVVRLISTDAEAEEEYSALTQKELDLLYHAEDTMSQPNQPKTQCINRSLNRFTNQSQSQPTNQLTTRSVQPDSWRNQRREYHTKEFVKGIRSVVAPVEVRLQPVFNQFVQIERTIERGGNDYKFAKVIYIYIYNIHDNLHFRQPLLAPSN